MVQADNRYVELVRGLTFLDLDVKLVEKCLNSNSVAVKDLETAENDVEFKDLSVILKAFNTVLSDLVSGDC